MPCLSVCLCVRHVCELCQNCIEYRRGRLKSLNQRLSGLAINNCCGVVCISHFVAGFLFTAGIRRPSVINKLLCIVNRVYDSKAQHYAEDNRIELYALVNPKQLVIKKLRSRYCTIKDNYWQTRSIVRPLCDSRATCDYVLPLWFIIYWHVFNQPL